MFLSPSTLSLVHSSLAEGGIFIINFGCRDAALRTSLLANLTDAFTSPPSNNVWTNKLEECVNEIVVCVKCGTDETILDDTRIKRHESVLRTMTPSIFEEDADKLCDNFAQLMCS